MYEIMHENNNDKDETTLLENLFELKSHRLPKQNELKKLFKKYLNICEFEDEFYKNGVHLGNSRYGYCCNIKQNHWIWLAFFQGLQPKDLKMLLIKRNVRDLTMPIWQEILDKHQNKSNHDTVNKENINLKKDVDIFQKHIWLSDGVFLIMSSSQYASNCQYQTYCFSPGKTLPKNFVNSLLLCATFTTELPLPIEKCLSCQGICSTHQNCIHISYVGGRTEGSSFFDINNGYLHKYAKEKKILISSITVNLIDNNLKLHLLRYGFKIAIIFDSKCYMFRIEYYSSKLSNLLTLFKSTISIEPMLNLLHTINVVTTPIRNQHYATSKVGLISTQQFKRQINNNLVSGGIPKLAQQKLCWSSDDELETETHLDNYLQQEYESADESLQSNDPLLNDESSGSSLLVEEVLRGVLTPLAKENALTANTLPYLPVIENNGKRNFANVDSANYDPVPSKKYKKYKTNLVLVESILNILKSLQDDNTKIKELYQLCNTDKEYIILVGLIHSWANEHPNYDFVKQFVINMFRINNESILKQIIRSEDVDIIYFMEICSYLYEHEELKSIFNEIDLSIAKLIISEIIIFRSKQYFYNTTRFANEYLLMKNNSKEELHPFLLDILSKQYKMVQSI